MAGRAEEGAQAHAHAVQQVLRAQERAGHTQRGLEQAGGAARQRDARDGDAEMLQVHDGLEDERAVAAQHDRAFGQHGGGLEQHVGGPGTEHARQGPARQGHGALHSAGGDEDLPRLHDVARPLMADIGPARGKVPDVRPAQEGGGGLAEFADEGFAARVIGPDLLAFVGGGGTGAAEDLASGLGLPVKDEDGKPVPRGLQRRAHACGPGPDNDDIPLRTHHLFSSVLKEGAPDCRFTDMPSRTGMRQDCWFGTPSISMRHS